MEVRRFTPRVSDGSADADTVAWMRAVGVAFLRPRVDPAGLARAAAGYDGHRLRAVDDPDAGVVGTLRSFDTTMTVPGGEVRAAGVTGIGVRPTHRRRGVLRALVDDDLAETARAGAPLAALTSTQGALYERFGFGLATWTRPLTVDTPRAAFRDAVVRGRCGIVEPGEWAPVLGPVHDRARRRHPGSMTRAASSWAWLADGAHAFNGMVADPHREAVVWRDAAGTAGGYAVYRAGDGRPLREGLELAVLDLQATSADSYRELWRYLCSMDLVSTVRWDEASVDEPLPWLLADPRACSTGGAQDMVWLRVLDVPAALAARRYPVADRIRLRVHDAAGFAAGSWLLDTHDRTAPSAADLGGGEVDAELPVTTLGSLYLGGADPRVLARAGRLTEHSPGAAGRLARLFAAPSVPWNGLRF